MQHLNICFKEGTITLISALDFNRTHFQENLLADIITNDIYMWRLLRSIYLLSIYLQKLLSNGHICPTDVPLNKILFIDFNVKVVFCH
jgi:hypothetical protein